MSTMPVPIPIRSMGAQPGERLPSRLEAAHRGVAQAHERIQALDAEVHAAFQQLRDAIDRAREEGAGVTVAMSAPLRAGWSVWLQGDESTGELDAQS